MLTPSCPSVYRNRRVENASRPPATFKLASRTASRVPTRRAFTLDLNGFLIVKF